MAECFRHDPSSEVSPVRVSAYSPGSSGGGGGDLFFSLPGSVSFFRRDSTMASLLSADSVSLPDPSPGSSFFIGSVFSGPDIVIFAHLSTNGVGFSRISQRFFAFSFTFRFATMRWPPQALRMRPMHLAAGNPAPHTPPSR